MMTVMMLVARLMLAAMLAWPMTATAQRQDRLQALFDQVDATAKTGNFRAAGAIAERAVALAESERPIDPMHRYNAIRFLRAMQVQYDSDAAYATTMRLRDVAQASFPPTNFYRLNAEFDAMWWMIATRKPGASLAILDASALAMAEAANGDEQRLNAAEALAYAARRQAMVGDRARSETLVRRVETIVGALPAKTARIGRVLASLGQIASIEGDPRRALQFAERAVSSFEAASGPLQHNIPPTLGDAAGYATAIGDYGRAETFMRRAFAIVDGRPGFSADTRLRVSFDYARFLAETRRYDLALPMIDKALAAAEALAERPDLADTATTVAASIYRDAGQPLAGQQILERGLATARRQGAPPRTLAKMSIAFADAALALNDLDAAEDALGDARAGLATASADDALRDDLAILAGDLALRRGRPIEAVALYEGHGIGRDPLVRARAAIRAAAARTLAGSFDKAAWTRARSGADAITSNILQTSVVGTGERRVPSDVTRLLDQSLAIAWAAVH